MSQLPPLTPERRRQRSALANARRLRPDDPKTAEIDRDYRAGRLADYIRQQVESAPPLTDDQREELARILRPAVDASSRLEPDFAREFIDATLGPLPGISAELGDDRQDGAA